MRHPIAWWVWALGLAAAASRGTSPWTALLLIMGAAVVAGSHRAVGAAPVLRLFAVIAVVALGIRLAGLVVFGSGSGTTILLDLPAARLWFGITVGGPLTLEALRSCLYTTGQLAAILIAFGAASELGPPRRLLPYLPASLYEVGTAVVVGLTYAPQLADHASAVRTARALRAPAAPKGGIRQLGVLTGPLLDASLDRSIALAASMESRGFGRNTQVSPRRRRITSAMSLAGLMAVVSGIYGLLNAGALSPTTAALLAGGVLASVVAIGFGRRSPRTRYRTDPWRWPEFLLLAGGLTSAGCAAWAASHEPVAMTPDPGLLVPDPPVVACLGILVAIGCALAVPRWQVRESR